MLIMKFGGTSVGSASAIEKLIQIVSAKKSCGKVIVVSAFSGVTDALIGMSRVAERGDAFDTMLAELGRRHTETAEALLQGVHRAAAIAEIEAQFAKLRRVLDGVYILRELSPRSLDYVMSFGERLSASLIAGCFRARGQEAEYLDSRKLIKTDERYGGAKVFIEETYKNIKKYMAGCLTPQIAAGFIASTRKGAATTLGRGGSDYTAALFGAALDAEIVEIWTDVDGILTSDPKMVKDAFCIDEISYSEAVEMSHFGAKVLYPPTVQPLFEKKIPIWIGNSFNPSAKGTLISSKKVDNPWPVRGISSLGNIALVTVQGTSMVGAAGFSSRLFGSLARHAVNVILITQASSEYSICFAVIPGDIDGALAAVEEEFAAEIRNGLLENPKAQADFAVIAVVGENMKNVSGISGKVFHALGRNGVNVAAIAQGSSEINISAVVAMKDEAKALNSIHEAFFLSGVRSVNLFLVGCGLIGGTLLDQINAQRETLAGHYKIQINICGLANSRKMIFDGGGIPSAEAKALLEASPDVFEINEFTRRMKALNLPNSCFCDCTASKAVAAVYETVLQAAVSIVTPNKKANSGAFDYYKRLTDYSRDRGIPYLYEVTVCAGLPVISTLRDLRLSGDRVLRIEAALSGTLSFIFNNFDGKKSFSALVREAKAKGYTEPDPRDDLNAMDAARKSLILARECGMPLEFSQVDIEPILPQACFNAPSVEAFFTELEKSDADFEERRAAAESDGRRLRYVAVIEEGSARMRLRAEPAESPFRSLVDSDNIVVITTERYSRLPMVIKGPGAGAQVTAAGVLADIVRIARTLV
ncbi:MAG: bifunctional aspartate kinase/homoserine dehydrogenase I [Spirochaetaceae bacterium]|jgi:aspartokinase/homoserine dehydrogenase 1|nr:bifunctional aspartate kinase/homoserine dehydrogenase I [Spirochaetaceae bacterium]